MRISTQNILIIGILSTILSGCETMNDIGSHFPVLGERCESSQCFTESGRAESERIKRMKADQEAARINGNATPDEQDPLPTPPPVTSNTPAVKSTGYSTKDTPWEQYSGQ